MLEFVLKYWIEVLFGIIVSLCSFIVTKIKKNNQDYILMKNSIKVILKSKISEIYNKVNEKKCISIYEKESLIDLYTSYKNLGGNSFIDDLIDDIDKYETKKDC